eukprot:SAG31_NODE_830_length_11688_cov_35.424023_1_plen_1846_part_00
MAHAECTCQVLGRHRDAIVAAAPQTCCPSDFLGPRAGRDIRFVQRMTEHGGDNPDNFENPLAKNKSPSQQPNSQSSPSDDGAASAKAIEEESMLSILQSKDSATVRFCKMVAASKVTEGVVMACVVTGTVALIIESPAARLDPTFKKILGAVDVVIGLAFTLEMAVRMIAMGVLFSKDAYLRNSWCVLDFVVVVGFWVGLVMSASSTPGFGGASAVRALRSLRSLRMLNSFEKLQQMMHALAVATPYVVTVLTLLFFFFVLFGTMGIALFAGASTRVCEGHENSAVCAESRSTRAHQYIYWNCSEMPAATECPASLHCDMPNKCRLVPNHPPVDGSFRADENGYIGFDNMLVATLTLFVVTTGDEWTAVHYAIATSDISSKTFAWPYFATIIVLLSLVTAELFTAVIAFAFTKQDTSFSEEKVELTIWVGGIDESIARENVVRDAFAGAGQIMRVQVRVKPGMNKCWALVTFGDVQATEAALSGMNQGRAHESVSAQWHVKRLEPSRLRSLRAQFVQAKQIDRLSTNSDISRPSIDALPQSGKHSETFELETRQSSVESPDARVKNTRAQPYVPGLSDACRRLVNRQEFEVIVVLVIIVNAIVMGSEHFDGTRMVMTPMYVEYIFLTIFSLEILIKVFAVGIKEFVSGSGYGFNLLDTLVVVFGIVGLLIDSHGTGVLRIFRVILRCLRLLKMAKIFSKNETLSALVDAVFGSIKSLMNLLVLIGISIVSASVLGMHLMGFECHTQLNGDPMPLDRIPRSSYASFWRSMLTTFEIMTGEDWAMIMYEYMHCYGISAALFFCLLFIYTNWCLLSMFVAVVLENFEIDDTAKMKIQQSILMGATEETETNRIRAWFSGCKGSQKHYTEDSLGCLGQENQARKACYAIVNSAIFEWAIIACIMLSTASLAAEKPPLQPVTNVFLTIDVDHSNTVSQNEWERGSLNATSGEPLLFFDAIDLDGSSSIDYMEFRAASFHVLPADDSTHSEMLHAIDTFVFIVFWVELALKVVAHGFMLTRNAYIADPWNQFDLLVVFGSTVDLLLRSVYDSSGAGFIVLRAFRMLRPLRLINHNPGMKVIVNTVTKCIPLVVGVTILVLVVMFVFAVLGVGFFAGSFLRCEPDDTLDKHDCIMLYGQKSWDNPGYSFDNVFDALETLFICSTTEGWVSVMHSGQDAVDIGRAPVREAHVLASVYFVVFMIVGNFFLSQLFVGVLVTSFSRSSGTALLTDAQMKWVQLSMITMHVQADAAPQPKNPVRATIYKFVQHKSFGMFIFLCIAINVAMMSAEHFPQPQLWSTVFEQINHGFVGIFVVETLLKLVALGPRHYFGDSWNLIDFLVVVISVGSFFVKDASAIQGARSLRALRVLLMVKNVPSIREIFTTLIVSIPPTLNIMCLLGILILVYGILGVQLYGGLPPGPRINVVDNFDDIQHAMFLLFQCATGQDFLGLMIELRLHGCSAVSTFFISYYVSSVYLFLNIFIAALLENFEITFDVESLDIKSLDIEAFQQTWETHNPRSPRMQLKQIREFAAALPGIWKVPLQTNPKFWYNELLLELGIMKGHDYVNDADLEQTLGFRRILLAISATVLSEDCQSLQQQVERAAEHTRHMRLMAQRLIVSGIRAKVLMLRVRKQNDLTARQKVRTYLIFICTQPIIIAQKMWSHSPQLGCIPLSFCFALLQFWRVKALMFARDAMIYFIVKRSKLARVEAMDDGLLLELAERKLTHDQGIENGAVDPTNTNNAAANAEPVPSIAPDEIRTDDSNASNANDTGGAVSSSQPAATRWSKIARIRKHETGVLNSTASTSTLAAQAHVLMMRRTNEPGEPSNTDNGSVAHTEDVVDVDAEDLTDEV